jgi:uncharacterized circularly permuted ATP-grasp superfamily protein/uncharacterized alpha-E superfamily protein
VDEFRGTAEAEKRAVADTAAGSAVPPGAVYDEMVTGTGQVRSHWQKLMGRLSPLDPAMLEERRDEAVQLLRQHGVTHAIYGDSSPGGEGQAAERQWPLDLLPFVIDGAEWTRIEAGVVQRARLLNAIMADIYGPQRLIADGGLPPALLHANPAFLHPCWTGDSAAPGRTHLHFTAFDLCRGPDGRWRVLSDRTQAPSGAGYALENRSVIGRVLADCFGPGVVQPLAPFFAAFRDNLQALLPPVDAAKVVLLTPGPYNETYFEHVYLARHLGITLVEGNDLTVRDRRVYLKTLSGLERVGVILRRLDDDFCDPIELRAASALGIPGLVEVVRAGNVVIANALGSGVMEAPAFKPLLASLAPALLGEELILPDVPSFWCGRKADRDKVLSRIDSLVIKSAFSPRRMKPAFVGQMSRAEREALIEAIGERPHDFVGQERIALSTAPVWSGERLEPRPMLLRVFVAAVGDRYMVMPGGLTRTAPSEAPVVSMQLGGGSKDSWVLAIGGEAESQASRPSNITPLPQPGLRRPLGGELPSRVADGLFWVGRYAERADGAVRLLRSLLIGVTDAVQPWRYRDAEPILNFAAWLDLVPLVDHPQSFQPISLVQSALLDPNHPGGIIANLQRLLTAARRVRDRLPPDCWRIFVNFDRHVAKSAGRAPPVRLLLRLEELITLGAGLAGATTETMPRDAGWRFLEIGRRLERAIYLIGMLRSLAQPPGEGRNLHRPIDERRLLSAILALSDSRISAGGDPPDGRFDRPGLLRAILADEADPRSLVFQLSAIGGHLAALPRPAEGLPSNAGLIDSAIALTLAARNAVPDAILGASQRIGSRAALVDGNDPLRAAFTRLSTMIPQISDLLTQAYFTHVLVRSA